MRDHVAISIPAARPCERSPLKALTIATLATAALLLPLLLWRSLYPVSDWSVLFLAVLAVLLFAGTYSPTAAVYRARLNLMLRARSRFSGLLTGRLHAAVAAIAFSAVALPVLAWQALTATPAEMTALGVLSIAASGLSFGSRAWLQHDFTPHFVRPVAVTTGALVAAVAFLPVLVWINFNLVPRPGAIQTQSLSQAIMAAIGQLPDRRGWIAEILSVLYAFDAAKLWVAAHLRASRWPAILFSLDAALVGFVVARASTTLTGFISDRIEGQR